MSVGEWLLCAAAFAGFYIGYATGLNEASGTEAHSGYGFFGIAIFMAVCLASGAARGSGYQPKGGDKREPPKTGRGVQG